MARILLIDDEPDIRDLMRLFLEMEGHEVTSADNAADGIARAREAVPELILMDLSLPGGFDGFEATRRLREDSAFDAVPIVALTAHAMKEHRERALAVGCDAHWTKPIMDLQAFAQSLTRMVAEGRAATRT